MRRILCALMLALVFTSAPAEMVGDAHPVALTFAGYTDADGVEHFVISGTASGIHYADVPVKQPAKGSLQELFALAVLTALEKEASRPVVTSGEEM